MFLLKTKQQSLEELAAYFGETVVTDDTKLPNDHNILPTEKTEGSVNRTEQIG